MNEYKYFNKFLEEGSINIDDIIIQEVDMRPWGAVDIYIVERYKDNVYTITTAKGDVLTPIDISRVDRVILGESQIKKLFQKIK